MEVAGGRLVSAGSKLREDAEAGDKLLEDAGDKLARAKEASRALRRGASLGERILMVVCNEV